MTRVDPSKPVKVSGRYPALLALILVLVIMGSLVVTVTYLNRTLFSPSEFVRDYLLSLVHNDVNFALQVPGVNVPEDQAGLLQNGSLGAMKSIKILTEEELTDDAGNQLVKVTFSFLIGGEPAKSSVLVQQTGTSALFFPSWKFAQDMTAKLSVRVVNADTFRSNGLTVESSRDDFLLLVPGQYTFDHESQLLTAEPRTITLLEPTDESQFVTIEANANETFTELVQKQVTTYLRECATQRVLYPTNCPFGHKIENRLQGEPEWEITALPEVELTPSEDGLWRIRDAKATATVSGTEVSLYNGSTEAFEENVTFTVDYLVAIEDGYVVLYPHG